MVESIDLNALKRLSRAPTTRVEGNPLHLCGLHFPLHPE